MGLVKITFDGSSVSAKQDADLNYHINGMVADGVLKGLGNGLTVSTSNNYIIFSSGYVQIYGRRIFVEQNTQIYISLDSTKYGYVIIDVDLTTNAVGLSKLELASGYPTLTQQNLSQGGTRYQMAIARYTKTSSSLTLDTSFQPTQIETPLSVANSGYDRAGAGAAEHVSECEAGEPEEQDILPRQDEYGAAPRLPWLWNQLGFELHLLV